MNRLHLLLLLLVLFSLAVVMWSAPPHSEAPLRDEAGNAFGSLLTQETDPLLFNEYWIRDFRLRQRGDEAESMISATLLVQRKRVTRFFIYHNMRELYLQNFSVSAVHASRGGRAFLAPLQELAPALMALESGKSQETLSRDMPGDEVRLSNADNSFETYSPTDMMSRIVAVPASFRIVKGDCSMLLSARRFRLELNGRYAALEGNVAVTLSSGEQYDVPRLIIVFSKDGLFFEEKRGFFRNYVVGSGCRLKRTSDFRELQVADALEEQEQKLLEQIGPKLPLHIRLLLGG